VTFLWIVVLMNAYNFMDGIDGLAGVFAITVLLGLFALYLPEVHQTMALRAHLWVVMMLAAVLVGLSLGFLFYNWRGGWTFLGDCGSQYVGFVLAAILAQLTRVATEPAVNGAGEELDFLVRKRAYVDFPAAVILVFPFLYDVTYTLIRRLLHGKAVWRAHHEHLYQRLIDRGWSHKGVVLFNLPFYLLNSAIFVAYCWAQNTQVQRIWPGAGEGVATLLRHRGFWAAAALALMILYTLIVIAVEKIRPLAPAVAAEASAPTPAEPPAEAAPEAPGPADTPKI
jgi:UDP-N-acetylmuramyl pentapeptide phosphotransferase/UDP-N-acetylglucosamine-1-phosphate transferase